MIKVIKIGGNIVDNPELLKKFAKDFAEMPGMKLLPLRLILHYSIST